MAKLVLRQVAPTTGVGVEVVEYEAFVVSPDGAERQVGMEEFEILRRSGVSEVVEGGRVETSAQRDARLAILQRGAN
jgi:hypothetical protein